MKFRVYLEYSKRSNYLDYPSLEKKAIEYLYVGGGQEMIRRAITKHLNSNSLLEECN